MSKTPIGVPKWAPGLPSVWIVAGSRGMRVVDQALAIGAQARMLMLDEKVDSVTVHAQHCGLGKVDVLDHAHDAGKPVVERCTCTPAVIER